MASIEWVGLLAAFLTTASFLPQAIMVLRTRNTDGISLVMYAMFTFGVAVWLVYGLFLGSVSIIVANLITVVLAASILGVKAKNTIQTKAQGATASTSAPIAS